MIILKLRIVSSKSEIDELDRGEQEIHLAFRASNTDIFKLLQSCPRLRAIQVPMSYRRTLSKASEIFLAMQGIELIEGDVWGHRKDINEYYTIDESVLQRIDQLRANGISAKEIADTLSKETKLSPELVKYVIKLTS